MKKGAWLDLCTSTGHFKKNQICAARPASNSGMEIIRYLNKTPQAIKIISPSISAGISSDPEKHVMSQETRVLECVLQLQI